ncbi:MAG: C25 family cysteine peptidase [Caldilineaceae bacterium]
MDHKKFHLNKLVSLIVATFITFMGNFPIQAQTVQPANTADALQIAEMNDTVTITWPNPQQVNASAATALQQLPRVRYQGYELPMQLITLQSDNLAAVELTITQLDTSPWGQTLQPAAPLEPPAIDWTALADPNAVVETTALPTAPVFILRQGKINGQWITVVAVSPLYSKEGVVQIATGLRATVPHARAIEPLSLQVARPSAARATLTTDLPPQNGDATRQAVKIRVSVAGMQEISGQMLATAGVDLATANPAHLQIKYQGQPVAIQVDGLVNNKLTTSSTLRFYAPDVGDRWNLQTIYWLTEEAADGLRMAERSVAPDQAATRATAFEQGVWSENQLYDSRYGGIDGDHWFHEKLPVTLITDSATSAATDVASDAIVPITVTHVLPQIEALATFTVAVTTNIRGEHDLRANVNSQIQEIQWNSADVTGFTQNWQHAITFTTSSNVLDLTLIGVKPQSSQSDNTVLLDRVEWQLPVALNFGGSGAQFVGVSGLWRYTWSNLPANYQFYDVTNAQTPVRLAGATAAAFQDGPIARRYLVTGPGTLQTPTVAAHAPVALPATKGADAIYIAPAQFMNSLAPLTKLRRDQGYQIAVVNVQEIYDLWSYGMVSAEAIRTFLRYAAATWQLAPQAVTLVGDGTWDPHNYEGKDNIDFIPPYLVEVDPWLGEAACENCYVQLDGDDPVTGDDPAGHFFAIDLWLGRLPVKSSGELDALVNKIVQYETMQAIGPWQNRELFIADNYIKSVSNTGVVTKDLAGDFAQYSEGIAELSPPTMQVERIYYDPYPKISDPTGTENWRIANAKQAFEQVMSTLSSGVSLVTYNGHSHHWQWAITDETPGASPNYLLGLYDTDALTNKDRYFITLSMTCLTSQFPKPAFSGTVLDERMILNPQGGAVAVWGPAGLSVAFGHDLLQRGFYKALWTTPPMTAKIGALVTAGYTELLTQGTCCQDTLRTFLLLGDPLMTVHVWPQAIPTLYLPIIEK